MAVGRPPLALVPRPDDRVALGGDPAAVAELRAAFEIAARFEA